MNPESGKEISDPKIKPIPVRRKGGMSESRVARVASEAHRTIAPSAKRSALIVKSLLELLSIIPLECECEFLKKASEFVCNLQKIA